ncbi:transmembrane amino acid transporter protein [Gigaspora rosea]|uniref:Transmembrane amino acid transporter protein n=1 Tax=Gigaspora rosea TaxID=44941 RepID=A0A397V6N1_9GLOM|nr:transmembrane amino acid transporter protein [Gigaspora rosea]
MLLRSWIPSLLRSQKYHDSNNDNSNSRAADNNDSRQNADLENESTRLLNQHTTSDLEGSTKDYRNLMSLGKSSIKQTIFNAVNILVGISILALPLAFKYSGWIIGFSIFFFCLISTNYTAKLLKKCLDTDPECLTYADLAYLAYGQKGKIFAGLIFLLDLRILTASSLALVLLFDGLTKFDSPGSLWQPMNTHLFPPNLMVLPLSFGLIDSAFSGHAVFPSLYRDMANHLYFKKTVNFSYLISGIIYITVIVCGYLMFGSETMDEITQNIMSTEGYSLFLNSIVVWLIVINPLAKYPLTLTPINLITEETFFQTKIGSFFKSKIVKFLFIILSRSLVSFIIIGTAIIFPGFDRAMSLLGSFFSFLISIICPLLFHLKMFGRYLSKKELILDLSILVVSSIMATLGTIWTFLA